jgi:cyanophycinase-like exopeptidase
MIKRLLFILIPFFGFSQGYTSYFTGNPTNITTTTEFGVCIMGGATEHDNAMIWLLQKANHGDIVILRSSGSDGYNDYLYSGLGVSVNSVETLVITSVAGATNPYVLDKVANAEMIWFAGGNQWNYISYFKDNALEDLINAHVNVKNAPIGGTSAGMAILGGQYFTAENGTVTSAQAMNNPYATNVTLDGYNYAGAPPTITFLNIPFMRRVITDTHYDNPDRRGRHATFLARIKVLHGINSNTYGIACNEYVAVCIGADGIAHVYGDYPNYQEFAYFIQPNCEWINSVENCTIGQPLTWNYYGSALKAYKVPGTMNGTNYYDLNNWEYGIGSGGSWEHWTVNNGVFAAVSGSAPSSCNLNNPEVDANKIFLYPNPVKNTLYIDGLLNGNYTIYDTQGRLIKDSGEINSDGIEVSSLSNGLYLIKITAEGKTSTKKFIKE